jgi:glycosyltransferase involved in cell wall biosynthesis
MGDPFEIVFIDDGSTDASFEIMRELHEKDPRVRVLRFNANHGKAPALAAGFTEARGRIIVTIDADLQDEPAEIPHLIEKLNEGYDLVSGWKKDRHDPLEKRLFSKFFNYVVARASGIPLHDFNCGLKCYRTEVLERVHLYGEMHRFVPVLAGRYGFRIGEIPVTHHPRTSGRSKYGMERILRGFLDFGTVMFFTHYVQRPSHLFGRLGLTVSFLGLIVLVLCLIFMSNNWFNAGGIALAISIVLFLMGFQAIILGLIAEMLTYMLRGNEPPYFINERLG